MNMANAIESAVSSLESVVFAAVFATPAELMKALSIDYATFCDIIELCNVRGVFCGNAWGYVAR
jgi:hypothetical protein